MPHKLLFVLPHLRAGGIEHVVRELVNRLDREHWTPILVLGRATGDLFCGVSRDVQIIDCGGRRALLLPPILAGIIRRERPDLIYSGTNAMNIAALLAQRMLPQQRRAHHIISEHTTAAEYLRGAKATWLRRQVVRRLYPDADRLAVPLESIALDWKETLQLGEMAIAVLPNPVLNEATLEALDTRRIVRQPFHIAAAGRLIRDKGHDVLIDAFAALRVRIPQVTLDIFGRGPEENALTDRIERLGLTGAVNLRGYTDDILGEFARARVVALASRREGFGNVLIEALAAGAEVVATDCLGPREILRGGQYGTLVLVGDVAGMANGLEKALNARQGRADCATRRALVGPYRVGDALRAFEAVALEILTQKPSLHTWHK